jgi:ABC-type Fe3+/spermidine/putrescine transport system ATPase subunit
MSLLEVDQLSKSYDGLIQAVRDVNLSLAEGEILCLLGPSGCGKTTLLRLVAGLERPDAGRIRFDGRDVNGLPPHARGFGMMFQDFALFPHKDVRGNVAFGLRMRRYSLAQIEAQVTAMLALVDMSGYEERAITQLSGGEQQRVALARALAPGPRLLMLDEPLGALDRALRERLMVDLRAILKQVGMTAIYVTHDQTEAFAVSDRMAVMNAGAIEQIGSPQEVHERPATPFVARFLGFYNLISGHAAAGGEIDTPVGRFRPAGPVPPPDTPVTLLIKPVIETIEAGSSGEAAANQLIGRVDALTFRGRFSQVWLAAGGRRLLFEEPGALPFQPGDSLRLTIAPEQLLIYESSAEFGGALS